MKKILVIEDTLEVRENLVEILELSNYEVVSAENGKIGVQLVTKENPDIILCDVMMPELDGFGVLKILDRNPNTSGIPFIFLTAKADKLDIRKGMNLGADDYITKPFDDVELLDAIEMRLKKSERLKKAFDGSSGGLKNFMDEAQNEKILEEISVERETKKYKKKELIYEEGQKAKRLYFVASGKVKTYQVNDWGKELITGIVEQGSFLGFKALVTGEDYEENASSLEDAEITYIPKEDFFNLLYNNRNFAARFIKMLTNNVKDQEKRLLSLAYNSIRKRVAEALVKVQSVSDTESISIQRDDLASMVGTAKESVIRTLSDFKSEGLISIEKNKIKILDLEELKDLPA